MFFEKRVYPVPDENSDVVHLGFVGDILLHPSTLRALDLGFNPFVHLVEDFVKLDLCCANLETPLANGVNIKRVSESVCEELCSETCFSGDPFSFNGPAKFAKVLKTSGIGLVSTANNHLLDRGDNGAKKTIIALEEQGVMCVGTRLNAEGPMFSTVSLKGMKFSFVGCSFGTNGRIDREGVQSCPPRMLEVVIPCARAQADFVVLFLHWGTEYASKPNPKQKEVAQHLINLGVDIIVGTHPHVLQPIEHLTSCDGRRCLVMYSLGTFLSSCDTLETKSTILAQVSFFKSLQKPEFSFSYFPLFVQEYFDHNVGLVIRNPVVIERSGGPLTAFKLITDMYEDLNLSTLNDRFSTKSELFYKWSSFAFASSFSLQDLVAHAKFAFSFQKREDEDVSLGSIIAQDQERKDFRWGFNNSQQLWTLKILPELFPSLATDACCRPSLVPFSFWCEFFGHLSQERLRESLKEALEIFSVLAFANRGGKFRKGDGVRFSCFSLQRDLDLENLNDRVVFSSSLSGFEDGELLEISYHVGVTKSYLLFGCCHTYDLYFILSFIETWSNLYQGKSFQARKIQIESSFGGARVEEPNNFLAFLSGIYFPDNPTGVMDDTYTELFLDLGAMEPARIVGLPFSCVLNAILAKCFLPLLLRYNFEDLKFEVLCSLRREIENEGHLFFGQCLELCGQKVPISFIVNGSLEEISRLLSDSIQQFFRHSKSKLLERIKISSIGSRTLAPFVPVVQNEGSEKANCFVLRTNSAQGFKFDLTFGSLSMKMDRVRPPFPNEVRIMPRSSTKCVASIAVRASWIDVFSSELKKYGISVKVGLDM